MLLWKLTWLEIKVFAREPLGLIGTVAVPVLVFVLLGRVLGGSAQARSPRIDAFVRTDLPVLAAILMALSAVLSLVTIIAIYREGGILRRLRATPLQPWTILTAHVLVKLLFTAITLALLVLAGRRYYPADVHIPFINFTLALLLSTLSILSIGFLVASLVPTARFAQPIGAIVFYPMVALSGLFAPIASFPGPVRIAVRLLPLPYAASLLKGLLKGETWSAHASDVAALIIIFVVVTSLAMRVFRWV